MATRSSRTHATGAASKRKTAAVKPAAKKAARGKPAKGKAASGKTAKRKTTKWKSAKWSSVNWTSAKGGSSRERSAAAPSPGSTLSHLAPTGEAWMVDVSQKPPTERTAIAEGRVIMSRSTLELICSGHTAKGDVFATARIGAIMAAKRTSELIPLCHPLSLSKVTVDIIPDSELPGCVVRATVKVTGPTGVEMEALTAVSVGCLTIYDMIKAVERAARIEGIHLVEKMGGKSGHYRARPSRS